MAHPKKVIRNPKKDSKYAIVVAIAVVAVDWISIGVVAAGLTVINLTSNEAVGRELVTTRRGSE